MLKSDPSLSSNFFLFFVVASFAELLLVLRIAGPLVRNPSSSFDEKGILHTPSLKGDNNGHVMDPFS